MCTELVPTAPTEPGAGRSVSRRAALVGSAGLAASTVLTGVGVPAAAAEEHSRRPRRHGTLDLTHTLSEDFPAYAAGEEAVRRAHR